MLQPQTRHELRMMEDSAEKRKHSEMLPSTIRPFIIYSPSNCDKTNVLSLFESPNGVQFKNVYFFKIVATIKNIDISKICLCLSMKWATYIL